MGKSDKTIEEKIIVENNAEREIAATKADEVATIGFWGKVGNIGFFRWCKKIWTNFKGKHPGIAQFLVFFMLSNGVTVLQFIMMPVFKMLFGLTTLIDVNFQIWHVGYKFGGDPYYVFDYAKGALAAGGGGGLAYFLSVQVAIGIAQVINFFAQRNITFKANNNVWYSAMWYVIAYIFITIVAAALQGFYKAPIYNLLINTWSLGAFGETLADIISMFINTTLSFWVCFPIYKIIFRRKKEKTITDK